MKDFTSCSGPRYPWGEF